MPTAEFVKRQPWLMRALWAPIEIRRRWKSWMLSPYEQALDRFIDRIDGDISLRVPEFAGTFFMNPRSDLFRSLVRYGFYEPEMAALFKRSIKPDRDIVDVGANLGFFTVLGAKALNEGRVLAIEPTSHAFSRLRANVDKNGVDTRVILYRGAASSHPGEITLNVIPGREEYSSVGDLVHPKATGTARQTEIVKANTVDALVEAHGLRPSLIKMDVEGAEGLVMAGAMRTIAEFRPIVLSEISNALLTRLGTHGKDIVSRFEALGYLVSDVADPKHPAGTRDFGDIFCIPRELAEH